MKPQLRSVPNPAPTPAAPPQAEGHGRRLTAAFEALEAFPALAESRNRLLRILREDRTSAGDIVQAIESDVALAIAVLRIANRTQQPGKKGKVTSIPKAVQIISPAGVEALANRTAVFDFFERTPGWDVAPERFRIHARSEEHTSELQSRQHLVCRLLLEKKKT